ncbi:hypothetical protein FH972_025118 [Carpinus fangiana]|uniref:PUL domain-containing protein n=1 Tax=Carpinus fangiana TaxID=176857 RepID=A0A5N6L0E7_9ROSI|nr:hypothetical protein FH972_025118 [Carpinus fangiana]
MADFKISASLQGHEDDVRGVVFASATTVVSCSRDSTVRSWTLTQPSPPTYDDSIAFQGSAFINAVAYIQPSTAYPEGLVVSGGKDAIIDIRQPGRPPDANAERMLLGHEGNVCALDVSRGTPTPYIVSGSWDGSARIWDVEKGQSTATLEGHGASVWGVLWYDADIIITACADQNIRIFSASGKLRKEFKASTEVVRALCRLNPDAASGAAFASAGNDGIIKLWTLDGVEVAQLHGHSNFVYTLACLPSGEIVSSSEDRTVRIWKDGQCVQTITHPAISVWSVAASENGDIVTGASDRIARVFTRSPDRVGNDITIAEFEAAVKGSSIPKQQMGEINKEQLPGPDFLTSKSGTKEGQVQMIREPNGNVSAHTWSTAAQQWINVGTVVDAAGSSGRKTEFMGKDYDYVFDVDIEEGKPPLKLPFNVSQNPYEVAQQWIANNELPMTYIDQVANFIITNTQGATLGQASGDGPGADPWGSERRYRPEDASAPVPAPVTRQKVLPQKEYLTITTASFSIIQKKLGELNQELLKEGRKDIALNPTQVEQLPVAIKELESSTSSPKSSSLLDGLSDAVVTIVTSWPDKMRLPGLDLLRCLTNASKDITQHHDIVAALKQSEALTNGNANTAMLAIRALANLFGNAAGQQYAAANFESIHALVAPHAQPTAGAVNRNVHIALTTLHINYAVLLTSNPSASGSPAEAASRAATLLQDLTTILGNSKIVDSETVYRALVAVGTLLRVPPADGVQVDGAAIEQAVKRATGSSKEPRIKGLAGELDTLL